MERREVLKIERHWVRLLMLLTCHFFAAGTVSAAVEVGMYMDFKLKDGSTVRVFPAATDSSNYGLNPSWNKQPGTSQPEASDNSCTAIHEALKTDLPQREIQQQESNMGQMLPANYPGWLKSAPGKLEVTGTAAIKRMRKPTDWYYLPNEPRVSIKNGRPEATFLKFQTDEVDESGEAVAEGGIFHLMATVGLTTAQQAELRAALARAVPGARLRGAVDMQPSSRGEQNFIVTSAALSDSDFSTGLVTSGFAPSAAGGKAALAGRLTSVGATLLETSLGNSTADLSLTFAYQYVAKVPAFNAKVTIDLDRIKRTAECMSESQTTHRRSGWKFGGWKALFGIPVEQTNEVVGVTQEQLEEAFTKVRTTGGVKIEIDQSLPDIDISVIEQSLVQTAMGAFMEMQKSFTTTELLNSMPMPEDDDDEEGSDKPNSENYRIYKVRISEEEMSGKLVFEIDKRMAVYRDHYITGNMGAEMRRYKDQVFQRVDMRDDFFKRGVITAGLDTDAIELFGQGILQAASVEVRVPFKEYSDFTDNELFTHQKVAAADTQRLFTYSTGGEAADPNCLYEYKVVWRIKGGRTYPKSPRMICGDSIQIPMESPVEPRQVSVEADLNQFNDVGIGYAEVQFRYPQFGRPTEDSLAFRVSEFNASQYQTLYVDTAKGSSARPAIEYRVVMQHKTVGTLPPSPWIKMELGNVYVNFAQLPASYLRSISSKVDGSGSVHQLAGNSLCTRN